MLPSDPNRMSVAPVMVETEVNIDIAFAKISKSAQPTNNFKISNTRLLDAYFLQEKEARESTRRRRLSSTALLPLPPVANLMQPVIHQTTKSMWLKF